MTRRAGRGEAPRRTFAWTGVYPFHFYASRQPAPDGSPSPTVQIGCVFDAAAGQGTVPASLIGQLPKGEGAITVESTSSSSTEVDGYAVELVVITGNLDGGGVTFQ